MPDPAQTDPGQLDLKKALEEQEALEERAGAVLYSEKRVLQCARGEITPAELEGITLPMLVRIAELGYMMYREGRFQESRIIFEGLQALDPRESYYRTALGAVLVAEGKPEEALGQFDAAVRLNPRDVAAWANRGELRLGTRDVVGAAADFGRVLELDPHARHPMTPRARALGADILAAAEGRAPAQRPVAPRSRAHASGDKRGAAKRPTAKKKKR